MHQGQQSGNFHQPQQAKTVPQTAHQATVEIVRNIVHLTGWALFRSGREAEYSTLRMFIQAAVHGDAKWAIERY
jgi:hypothetical protein